MPFYFLAISMSQKIGNLGFAAGPFGDENNLHLHNDKLGIFALFQCFKKFEKIGVLEFLGET